MRAARYPIQMVDGVPVVTAPPEIDITTAAELQAILSGWGTRGHPTVVVDMTGTRFCDLAGLRELVRAHQQAWADGGGLRLVTPADGGVLRVFTMTGLDRLIPHFIRREQALAWVPAAAVRPPGLDGQAESAAAPGTPPAQAGENGLVADSRDCEQCGAVFVPQREHARFCSADCRAAWNCEHMGDPADEASALAWSVTAMSEAAARLAATKAWDPPRAVAAIEEAVWWITMVDATLVRHHPGVYDVALTAQAPAERLLIEGTLAGLRFVRNWIGRAGELGELIETGDLRTGSKRIIGWAWRDVPEPPLTRLAPREQAWEMSRYRAYQDHLASHTIGETIWRPLTFVTLTSANAAPITEISETPSGAS